MRRNYIIILVLWLGFMALCVVSAEAWPYHGLHIHKHTHHGQLHVGHAYRLTQPVPTDVPQAVPTKPADEQIVGGTKEQPDIQAAEEWEEVLGAEVQCTLVEENGEWFCEGSTQ